MSWKQADAVTLPVDDASFSLVVSRSMFHHAADPAATLGEMRRACIPGGRLAVMDLSPEPAKAPAFDAFELLRDPSHAKTLTATELRQLGTTLGLKELATREFRSTLPLESVLATSFPPGAWWNACATSSFAIWLLRVTHLGCDQCSEMTKSGFPIP